MKLWQKIKYFYDQHVRAEDRLLLGLTIAAMLMGCVYIGVNALTTHYHGLLYLPIHWLEISPVIIALTALAMYARDMCPRIAFFTRTYGMYFIIFVGLSILTTGIQYTPFSLIDTQLVHLDQALGFHTLAVLNWTYAHPWLKNVFNFAYNSIGYQLFLIPLIIAVLMEKKSINIYFLTIIFSYFIGTTIYYFFPTAGPTEIFHSAHFINFQHDTLLKYLQIHHHLIVTKNQGGMIAFPSFHVIWATILVYLCIERKWIFYPLMVFNALVISSTLFLGWHYLTDVIGGIAVAVIAIMISQYVYRYFVADFCVRHPERTMTKSLRAKRSIGTTMMRDYIYKL